ncbi:MAG TPA: sulfatase, partial [Candidatus Saccharimonadales bacterium]|nr:sulfatase [Candidatus Saccharimonadales bacterium]
LWSRPVVLPRPDPARPNLVLISLDTLRADHLGAYGYTRHVSPSIDRLARQGVLFERAISQAPWTTPSHMSLFTSLYPTVHAVDSPTTVRQRRLAPGKTTLAEILSGAGYATAAFTGSGSISALYGFWHGFSVYDETDEDVKGRESEDVSEIFGKASRWLVEHRDLPFFLFFHTYEIHYPYTHDTFLDQAPPGDEAARETALYDGDIFQADAFVGHLVDLIDSLGIRGRTIIVLLSDHGEELDPRYPGKPLRHGHSVYQDLLHVPLVISAPPPAAAGLRVAPMVEIIDVMPTLLDLLHVPVPGDLQGVSLAAALSGGAVPERDAFSEATNYGPERKAIQDGRFKYIRTYPRTEKPAREIPVPVPPEELFDLEADPGERHSLLDAAPPALARLRAEMDALVKANQARRGKASDLRLDDETLERLKALGYVD